METMSSGQRTVCCGSGNASTVTFKTIVYQQRIENTGHHVRFHSSISNHPSAWKRPNFCPKSHYSERQEHAKTYYRTLQQTLMRHSVPSAYSGSSGSFDNGGIKAMSTCSPQGESSQTIQSSVNNPIFQGHNRGSSMCNLNSSSNEESEMQIPLMNKSEVNNRIGGSDKHETAMYLPQVQVACQMRDHLPYIQVPNTAAKHLQQMQMTGTAATYMPHTQGTSTVATHMPQQLNSTAAKHLPWMQVTSTVANNLPQTQVHSTAAKHLPRMQMTSKAPKHLLQMQATSTAPKHLPQMKLTSTAAKHLPQMQVTSTSAKQLPQMQLTSSAAKHLQKTQINCKVDKQLPHTQITDTVSNNLPQTQGTTTVSKHLPQIQVCTVASRHLPQTQVTSTTSKHLPHTQVTNVRSKYMPQIQMSRTSSRYLSPKPVTDIAHKSPPQTKVPIIAVKYIPETQGATRLKHSPQTQMTSITTKHLPRTRVTRSTAKQLMQTQTTRTTAKHKISSKAQVKKTEAKTQETTEVSNGMPQIDSIATTVKHLPQVQGDSQTYRIVPQVHVTTTAALKNVLQAQATCSVSKDLPQSKVSAYASNDLLESQTSEHLHKNLKSERKAEITKLSKTFPQVIELSSHALQEKTEYQDDMVLQGTEIVATSGAITAHTTLPSKSMCSNSVAVDVKKDKIPDEESLQGSEKEENNLNTKVVVFKTNESFPDDRKLKRDQEKSRYSGKIVKPFDVGNIDEVSKTIKSKAVKSTKDNFVVCATHPGASANALKDISKEANTAKDNITANKKENLLKVSKIGHISKTASKSILTSLSKSLKSILISKKLEGKHEDTKTANEDKLKKTLNMSLNKKSEQASCASSELKASEKKNMNERKSECSENAEQNIKRDGRQKNTFEILTSVAMNNNKNEKRLDSNLMMENCTNLERTNKYNQSIFEKMEESKNLCEEVTARSREFNSFSESITNPLGLVMQSASPLQYKENFICGNDFDLKEIHKTPAQPMSSAVIELKPHTYSREKVLDIEEVNCQKETSTKGRKNKHTRSGSKMQAKSLKNSKFLTSGKSVLMVKTGTDLRTDGRNTTTLVEDSTNKKKSFNENLEVISKVLDEAKQNRIPDRNVDLLDNNTADLEEESYKIVDLSETSYHPIALPLGCHVCSDSENEEEVGKNETKEDVRLGKLMAKLGQDKYQRYLDTSTTFIPWVLLPIDRDKTLTRKECEYPCDDYEEPASSNEIPRNTESNDKAFVDPRIKKKQNMKRKHQNDNTVELNDKNEQKSQMKVNSSDVQIDKFGGSSATNISTEEYMDGITIAYTTNNQNWNPYLCKVKPVERECAVNSSVQSRENASDKIPISKTKMRKDFSGKNVEHPESDKEENGICENPKRAILPVGLTQVSMNMNDKIVNEENNPLPKITTRITGQLNPSKVKEILCPVTKKQEVPTAKTACVPVEATFVQVKTTCVPVITTCVPVETTCVPIETTCMPIKTTCIPVKTTCVPIETTCMPVKTTCVPVKTTCVPIETTCVPVKATCVRIETTCMPVKATCVPVKTTCVPIETTCMPVITTCVPVKTTCVPIETTCVPVKTTCVPVKTTCVPIETTRVPVKTACVPVIPCAPVETICMPVKSTSVQNKTSCVSTPGDESSQVQINEKQMQTGDENSQVQVNVKQMQMSGDENSQVQINEKQMQTPRDENSQVQINEKQMQTPGDENSQVQVNEKQMQKKNENISISTRKIEKCSRHLEKKFSDTENVLDIIENEYKCKETASSDVINSQCLVTVTLRAESEKNSSVSNARSSSQHTANDLENCEQDHLNHTLKKNQKKKGNKIRETLLMKESADFLGENFDPYSSRTRSNVVPKHLSDYVSGSHPAFFTDQGKNTKNKSVEEHGVNTDGISEGRGSLDKGYKCKKNHRINNENISVNSCGSKRKHEKVVDVDHCFEDSGMDLNIENEVDDLENTKMSYICTRNILKKIRTEGFGKENDGKNLTSSEFKNSSTSSVSSQKKKRKGRPPSVSHNSKKENIKHPGDMQTTKKMKTSNICQDDSKIKKCKVELSRTSNVTDHKCLEKSGELCTKKNRKISDACQDVSKIKKCKVEISRTSNITVQKHLVKSDDMNTTKNIKTSNTYQGGRKIKNCRVQLPRNNDNKIKKCRVELSRMSDVTVPKKLLKNTISFDTEHTHNVKSDCRFGKTILKPKVRTSASPKKKKLLKKFKLLQSKSCRSLQTPKKKFPCPKVRFRLVTDRAVQKEAKKRRPVSCKYCRKMVPHNLLLTHVKQSHPFRCCCCSRLFTSRDEKRRHSFEIHGAGKARYHCGSCDRIFNTAFHMEVHCKSGAHNRQRNILLKKINMINDVLYKITGLFTNRKSQGQIEGRSSLPSIQSSQQAIIPVAEKENSNLNVSLVHEPFVSFLTTEQDLKKLTTDIHHEEPELRQVIKDLELLNYHISCFAPSGGLVPLHSEEDLMSSGQQIPAIDRYYNNMVTYESAGQSIGWHNGTYSDNLHGICNQPSYATQIGTNDNFSEFPILSYNMDSIYPSVDVGNQSQCPGQSSVVPNCSQTHCIDNKMSAMPNQEQTDGWLSKAIDAIQNDPPFAFCNSVLSHHSHNAHDNIVSGSTVSESSNKNVPFDVSDSILHVPDVALNSKSCLPSPGELLLPSSTLSCSEGQCSNIPEAVFANFENVKENDLRNVYDAGVSLEEPKVQSFSNTLSDGIGIFSVSEESQFETGCDLHKNYMSFPSSADEVWNDGFCKDDRNDDKRSMNLAESFIPATHNTVDDIFAAEGLIAMSRNLHNRQFEKTSSFCTESLNIDMSNPSSTSDLQKTCSQKPLNQAIILSSDTQKKLLTENSCMSSILQMKTSYDKTSFNERNLHTVAIANKDFTDLSKQQFAGSSSLNKNFTDGNVSIVPESMSQTDGNKNILEKIEYERILSDIRQDVIESGEFKEYL